MKTKLFILLLLLGFYSSVVSAQLTGNISGTVIDAENGETIIGASVGIPGTSKGAATDIDGNFNIRNIKPGFYTVLISYISYTPQLITEIEVVSGETVLLEIALESDITILNEVVVTAEAIKSGEAGLLSTQRKANNVQDGISSEEISKSTDGNIGSAMKRVSGVTVVSGKDIYVRGLGNRYSNVQLNDSPIPSTNPDKKEAPIDILSSGIVDNIIVQKTYTPDQIGEFSGGSVQIITKEFPTNSSINFGYSTEVNTNATFRPYLGYNGGGTDFLGYDDGFRSLPNDLNDGAIADPQTLEGRQEGARIVNGLNNSWSSKTITSIPSQKFSLSYSDQLNQDKTPIGIVSNVSYKYGTNSRQNESLRYISNFNKNNGDIILGSEYSRNIGEENTSLNAMLNVFIKPSSVTKIGFKNLYSNSSTNKYSSLEGIQLNFSDNRQTIAEFDRRSIFSSTLLFDSYFNDFMQSKLEASLTYSKAVRDLPDRRSTQYARNDDGNLEVFLAQLGNSHFFSFQNDNNYSGKLDYEVQPVEKITAKVGVFGLFKNRDFNSYKLVYDDNPNAPNVDKSLPAEQIFIADNISNGSLILTERTSDSRDSYQGEQELAAGYLSLNWNPTRNLNLVTGFRAEKSMQAINSNVLVDELDVLPAINATFRLTDRTNIRGAFSSTLARPEFRELSNFNFQDYIGGRTIYGNPDLERTKIFNYDLRFETFPKASELIAISLFYKEFENPIEVFYRITQNNEVQYNNVSSASLYGIELEGRKDLTAKLRMSTNFSYIYSMVNYEKGASVGRQANDKRPMFGQSPYSFNANLFYVMPDINSEFTLSFNTFGKRISAVGNNEQPDDEYEDSFNKLDFNFIKKIGSTSISASIENILHEDVVYKQGSVITNQYEVGTTFSLGFSYSFN